MYAFCWSCPVRLLCPNKAVLYHVNGKLQRAIIKADSRNARNRDISHLRVFPRAIPNSFFIMFILDERLLIKEEHQHSIQI